MTCPIPRPEEVDLVFYHHACQDGFGAAWAAHRRIGDASPNGVEIQYESVKYGAETPDVTGRHVAIVDFCFEREQLDEMVQKAASLIVLDHHKSSRESLEGGTVYDIVFDPPFGMTDAARTLRIGSEDWAKAAEKILKETRTEPRIERVIIPKFENALFDMEKSGAMLSWEFFHPGVPAPRLIEHLQDRDLWRFQLSDTKRVQAWLDKEKFEFEVWDEAAAILDHDKGDDAYRRFMSDGDVVLRYAQSLHERLAKHAHPGVLRTPLGELRVYSLNTCYFQSDVCHKVLDNLDNAEEKDPEAVAMAWFHDEKSGAFRCSLRSDPHRPPVDIHAKAFGGGGHRNAAGFEIVAALPLPLTLDPPTD